jgi:hypothetical protein
MTTGLTGSSTAAAGSSTSSATSGAVLASDAAACASRSFEVQQLAARVAACADNTDAVLALLAGVEMGNWQSPAGRAYRTALSLQAASLRRGRRALQEAVTIVLRHAQNMVQSTGGPG